MLSHKNWRTRRAVGWGILSLTFSVAPAQPSKSVVEAKASQTGATDAVVLSPFTVQSDRDTGYQATSTLAGTRLNTPIADLGASISVYTKEFLDDIGATNANELLIYATGMEAGGPGGNFSNAAGGDITSPQIVGDGVRNAPQEASRARGLAGPTFTRGFFASDVPSDGYNIGSVTVNRGPNAMLFGVAQPSGVVDANVNHADTRRNQNKFEFRYGNNDSLRESINLNRVLVPNKLGFRIAALNDEERYNQRPAFETKRRFYGALTFEPFRSTVIRGNFETGNTRANRPFSVLPFNSFQSWLNDGRQAFDWTLYDDPARNPAAAATSGGGANLRGLSLNQNQIFDTLVFPVANATRGGTIGLGFRATPPSTNTTGTGSLAANSIRNQLFDPVFNRDSNQGNDGNNYYETRNAGELPANYYADNRVPAGRKFQGFTDYANFDWRGQQLDETGRQSESFHNYTVTLEQRAWRDRIGFEAAYFSERYERRNRNNYISTQGNANHVRIDANVTLPDGRPNPNVGRPWVDSAQTIFNQNVKARESMRLTAFLRYDFKDLSPTWGKWLGRHVTTLLGDQSRSDQLNISSKFGFFGKYDDFAGADPYGFNRLATLIAYVGPSVIGNNNPVKLTPITIAPLQDGTVANATFWEVAAGDPAQAKLVTIPYTLRQIFRNGNYSRDVIKSKAVNLMSYWLDDLIVTNVGLRRDDDYFRLFTIPTGTTPEGLANLYKTERSFGDFVLPDWPPLTKGKQVKSYSAVLRWPQKFLRLPKGADLSVFNNISENFTPNAANTDAYGNVLPSPKGTTREFGLNFAALQNRFNVRLNRYETKVANASIGRIGALSAMINNVVLQTIGSWATEVNRNPAASRQADIDLLLNAFPSNWRAINQLQYTGDPAKQNAGVTFTQLPNYSDIADRVAKGTEIDVTFNLTRGWRVLFNFAKNETVQTNIAPVTRELVEHLTPVLNQLANRPKATAAATYVFPVDATGKVTSLDAGAGEGTLGQYVLNNVTVPLANTVASEGVASPEVRKYRANFVTSYSFSREHFLRGWAVGTGIRWQDKVGIGYPAGYLPSGAVFIDKKHPYFGPDATNVDAWFSYSRRIWNKRIDWKAQLNVRNVIGDDKTIAITVQPDGSPASVRLPPDRRWYLTNTFSF